MTKEEIIELFVEVEPTRICVDSKFKVELSEFEKLNYQVLYLMKNAFGLYKIGITNNPRMRLKQIEASSGIPTEILAIWQVAGAREYEKLLHSYFTNYRTIGEWFDFSTVEDIVDDIGILVYRMTTDNGTYNRTGLGEDEWGVDLP